MVTTIANTARALKQRAAAPKALPALLLLTDARRLADPIPLLAELPRGAAVVLRDYDAARDGAAGAAALARACHRRGLRLIIAGDAKLAARIGADGLHLPEWRLRRGGLVPRRNARRRGFIVTAACHSRTALVSARRAGVDAALLAPVFATASHPGAPPLGIIRTALLLRGAGVPVFALGGINTGTARRLAGSGVCGIAGIGFAAGPGSA